jgi:hypothetical protein
MSKQQYFSWGAEAAAVPTGQPELPQFGGAVTENLVSVTTPATVHRKVLSARFNSETQLFLSKTGNPVPLVLCIFTMAQIRLVVAPADGSFDLIPISVPRNITSQQLTEIISKMVRIFPAAGLPDQNFRRRILVAPP